MYPSFGSINSPSLSSSDAESKSYRTISEDIIEPRNELSAVAVNEKIYALGAEVIATGENKKDIIEVYYSTADRWLNEERRPAPWKFDIDVKCTIFENDNVDVRIYVPGLKTNSFYTAEIVPDNSLAVIVTGESDPQGVFWEVAKVNNGDKYSIFKVTLHEGPNASGRVLAYGDDREPCHQISTSEQPNDE
jgi:hypothetical protein